MLSIPEEYSRIYWEPSSSRINYTMGKLPIGWEYHPYLGNIVGSTGQPSSPRISYTMGKIPVGWDYYPYLGNIVGSTGQPYSSRNTCSVGILSIPCEIYWTTILI